MQFSLRMLLASIVLVGLACAAITNGSWYVLGAFYFFAGIPFLAAPVIAIVGQGRPRTFACGFAVPGWIYTFSVFTLWYFSDLAHGPQWLVSELALNLADTLPPSGRSTPDFVGHMLVQVLLTHGSNLGADGANVLRCYSVLHSMMALVVGGCGGCLALFVTRGAVQKTRDAPRP